jgi:hypothetical protein
MNVAGFPRIEGETARRKLREGAVICGGRLMRLAVVGMCREARG